MTFVLCAKCIDGIVLVSDKKVIYDNHQVNYQNKIFAINESIAFGYSGPVSSFEKFRDKLKMEYSNYDSSDHISIIRNIEKIVYDTNKEYEYPLTSAKFDLLVSLKTSFGFGLYHCYPTHISEEVRSFKVIGMGEPYGLFFLKLFWSENMRMINAAELGFRVIKYIEKYELNNSVGVGSGNPQILFFANNGLIKEANDVILDQFDKKCTTWLDNLKSCLLEKYKPAGGSFQYASISSIGHYGKGDGQFMYPEGIDIDSSGMLYVAAELNHCVQKFTKDGKFCFKFGKEGTGDGQLNVPYAVAISEIEKPLIYVYVTDSSNARVQKFDKDGNFVLKWGTKGRNNGQFESPHGIAIDTAGHVYVTDENNCVQKFDSNGKFVLRWGEEGKAKGKFNYPIGIVTEQQKYVYIADQMNHRIQKFTTEGEFILEFGQYGTGDGQFNMPHGITIDKDNMLYVTDSLNHRIQKFTTEGEFILEFGEHGSNNGQFDVPRDLVLDSSGSLFVSDSNNHSVHIFVKPSREADNIGLFN